MVFRFGVAGGTILRGSLENAASVAVGAGDVHVRPCQGERGERVVEPGVLPAFGGVALGAVLTELPRVGVVCLVTGVAILGCTLEYAVHVAGFASQIEMRPCQGKRGKRVVKGGVLPTFGGVTLGAVLTETSGVRVSLGVAREAVGWSIF